MNEPWMALALEEARAAAREGEAPVGAIVVVDGEVAARGRNRRETDRDPTAHAELIAVRDAAEHLGRWRLSGATVYVTLEPCPMCAGALILARVDRIVFGAYDPKAGACGSVVDLFESGRFNHRPEIVGGVMAEACGRVLSEFFEGRRGQQKIKIERSGSLGTGTRASVALR
ncbi:MAG: tRNA adenosine(34) deaminase TadA [Nitrospirota bacterium]